MSKWSAAYRDSRWQKKRLEVMNRDEWTCRSCGASGDGITLNVHHSYYESGKAPWEYDSDTLVTWCENCHLNIHHTMKLLMKRIVNGGGFDMLGELLGYSDGMLKNPCNDHPRYNHGYAACIKATSITAKTANKITNADRNMNGGAI
jgi:hypothetical protein